MAFTSWNDDSSFLYADVSRARNSVLPGMIMSVWVRNPTTIGASPVSIANGLGHISAMIQPIGLGGFNSNNSGTGYLSSPTATLSAGWHHLLVQFGATIDDQSPLYIDGIAQSAPVQNGTMDVFGAFGYMQIARRSDSGFPYAGDFAELAIWWSGVGLTVATLAANLASGRNPLLQATRPDLYYPFNTDYTTSLGTDNNALTLVGGIEPILTDHPPIDQTPAIILGAEAISTAGIAPVQYDQVIMGEQASSAAGISIAMYNQAIEPTGISTSVTLGMPTRASILRLNGIGSSAGLGVSTFASQFTLHPLGIVSTLSVVAPFYLGSSIVDMKGMRSAVRFGLPRFLTRVGFQVPSIPPSITLGSPDVAPIIRPTGIPFENIFGLAQVNPGTARKHPVGLASSSSIGLPAFKTWIQFDTIGIPSSDLPLGQIALPFSGPTILGHSQLVFDIPQAVNLTYLANTVFSGRMLHNDTLICSDFHLIHGTLNEVFFFIRDSARLPMSTGDYTLNISFNDQTLQTSLSLQDGNKGLFSTILSPTEIADLPLGPLQWSVTYQRPNQRAVALWTEHDSPYGIVYVHESPIPDPHPKTLLWADFSPLLTGEYYTSSLPGAAQNNYLNSEQSFTLSMTNYTGLVRIDGSLSARPDPAATASDWSAINSLNYRNFTGDDIVMISGNYVWSRVMVQPKSGSFDQVQYTS